MRQLSTTEIGPVINARGKRYDASQPGADSTASPYPVKDDSLAFASTELSHCPPAARCSRLPLCTTSCCLHLREGMIIGKKATKQRSDALSRTTHGSDGGDRGHERHAEQTARYTGLRTTEMDAVLQSPYRQPTSRLCTALAAMHRQPGCAISFPSATGCPETTTFQEEIQISQPIAHRLHATRSAFSPQGPPTGSPFLQRTAQHAGTSFAGP